MILKAIPTKSPLACEGAIAKQGEDDKTSVASTDVMFKKLANAMSDVKIIKSDERENNQIRDGRVLDAQDDVVEKSARVIDVKE